MSVLAIGADLVETARIREILERRGRRLAERILTPAELAQWDERGSGAAFLARRFAAKEAAAKALGTGIAQGIRFPDLEVANDPGGRPRLQFHGAAAEAARQQGVARAHLSISDERGYALAMVVLES